MEFGDKLRELRKESGLTQQQLAQQIGVTKSVISYYELNERTPSPEVLKKFSSVFHVTSDYLLGIERTKTLDISGLDNEEEKVVRILVEHFRTKSHK